MAFARVPIVTERNSKDVDAREPDGSDPSTRWERERDSDCGSTRARGVNAAVSTPRSGSDSFVLVCLFVKQTLISPQIVIFVYAKYYVSYLDNHWLKG
jgi:hypothetical protein